MPFDKAWCADRHCVRFSSVPHGPGFVYGNMTGSSLALGDEHGSCCIADGERVKAKNLVWLRPLVCFVSYHGY